MQGYNLILLYDTTAEHILMCKRKKDPYCGLYNLVGGKIEPGEDGLAAAYRELREETGVTGEDTELLHMMDFTYYLQDCYVEVYVGRLKQQITLVEEANPLFWSDLNHDFFSLECYAGEGNIGHILEQARIYCREI
jgi:8-oxo-dGTP diphosphatase